MLEGGKGFITVRGRESYYYSLTDLVTSGTVRVDGKWIPVKGRSWMDHQWADVAYTKDRWTWFSIQLNDGTDIMCVEYSDGREGLRGGYFRRAGECYASGPCDVYSRRGNVEKQSDKSRVPARMDNRDSGKRYLFLLLARSFRMERWYLGPSIIGKARLRSPASLALKK